MMQGTLRRLACIALGAAVGCGRGDRVEYDPEVVIDSVQPLPAESLSMPAYPDMERGRLDASSTGFFDITGSWTAKAETCDDPPILVVQALSSGARSFGVIILFHLSSEGRLGTYRIVTADSTDTSGAAALIGVQDHRQRLGHTYEAYAGSAELSVFDGRVSGRFAVTMRDFQSDVRVKYAGVFHELPVERFPEAFCRAYAEGVVPSDSSLLRQAR
jgi:hypothetical protein